MINIAITDDNNLFRIALEALLEQNKIRILFDAKNGQELIDKLSVQPLLPDVILIDYNMPVMDGRETVEVLTKLYPNIKIIALSGFYFNYLVTRFINAGAKGFLTKNVDPEILIQAITMVNDNKYYIETESGKFEILDNLRSTTWIQLAAENI
jgi:DNA-binding NarL/FixJ family response regulator